MSEHKYEVGTDVAFFDGRGEVVDVDRSSQKTLIKILTESGEVRLIPDNIPLLICT